MRWTAVAIVAFVLAALLIVVLPRLLTPDAADVTPPTIEDPETGRGRVTLEIVGHWPCLKEEVLAGVGGLSGDGWDLWRCTNREELP